MRAGWLGIVLLAAITFGCSHVTESDEGTGGAADQDGGGGTAGAAGADAGIAADGREEGDASPQLDAGRELDAESGSDAVSGFDAAMRSECRLADFEPPAVYMKSLGGEQTGVSGSYCTDRVNLGCGICVDVERLPEFREFTVAHPGDEVIFSMSLGKLVAGEGCVPECPPIISVYSGTCDSPPLGEHLVEEDKPWAIDLSAGVYSLWLNTHFQGADGLGGQASYLFGLLVDPSRDCSVVAAGSVDAGCEY